MLIIIINSLGHQRNKSPNVSLNLKGIYNGEIIDLTKERAFHADAVLFDAKGKIGKIKSEGLAYQTCKTIQETVGENFKVYYKQE